MGERVFNFYQSSGNYGTGLYNPTNPIDFFTGFYFPRSTSLGADVGFYWPASDRNIFQTTSISGKVEPSNKDAAYASLQFRGLLLPLLRDSGNLSVSIASGAVKTSSPDRLTYSAVWTGSQVSGNIDRPTCSIILSSGAMVAGNNDKIYFNVGITGAQVPAYLERIGLSAIFRGGFTPRNSDNIGISFVLSSITYATDVSAVTYDGEDNVALRFRLTRIIYSSA